MFDDVEIKALGSLQEWNEHIRLLGKVGQAVENASGVSALALHHHLQGHM